MKARMIAWRFADVFSAMFLCVAGEAGRYAGRQGLGQGVLQTFRGASPNYHALLREDFRLPHYRRNLP